MFMEKFPGKNVHIIQQELLIKSNMKNKVPPAITSTDRQLPPNINTNTFPPAEFLLIWTGSTEVRKVLITSKDLAKKRVSDIQKKSDI